LLLLPVTLQAQQHSVRAYDLVSGQGVGPVLIKNLHSGALWLTDSAGAGAFTAYPGDRVQFTCPGYRPTDISIRGYSEPVTVQFLRAPIALKEVEVLSPYKKFQQDSIFNHQLLRKEIQYAGGLARLDNISGGTGFGIGFNGIFSELALRLTGKKKAAKEAVKSLMYLENLQLNSIRYTPGLVKSQTGLDDSAAWAFIRRHPISNDFLRDASELELKQYIRDLFRADLKEEEKKGNEGRSVSRSSH